MKRRKLLFTGATAWTLALAGCASDDGDGDGGSDDGSSDEDGMEDDSENGDDSATDDGSDSDSDDGSDGDTDDGTDSSGEDDSDSNTDDGSDTSDEDSGVPTLGESYQWADSFIAEISLEQTEAEVNSLIMYFNGGNFRQEIETTEGTFEMYNVDGTLYQVQDGQCFSIGGGQDPNMDTGVDPQSEDELVGDRPELSPTGTDTIDGEEVYVYEYEFEGESATTYVSTETGYIRRVEFAEGTIDYRSWGDVDPIELPEACEQ